MKKVFVVLILLIFSVFLNGCKLVTEIDVNTVKPWEKRYSTNDVLNINGTVMETDGIEGYWILSNKTLLNLLRSAGAENPKFIGVK